MSVLTYVKNSIGALLGFPKDSLTGRTLFFEKTIVVPYTKEYGRSNYGVINLKAVSAKAMETRTAREIAEHIYGEVKDGQENFPKAALLLPHQIAEKIKKGEYHTESRWSNLL